MTIVEEAPGGVEEQAAHWLAVMHSGDVSPEDEASFEAWMGADRGNALAFRRFEQLYRDLGGIELLAPAAEMPNSDAPMETHQGRSAWSGWIPAMAASLLVVLGGGAWFGLGSDFWGDRAATQATMIATKAGESREQQLEDGSRVALGPLSAATVRMAENRRFVELTRGEALFDVTSDGNRPFYVQAGNATVRVTGTRFEVRRNRSGVLISVAEGSVRVDRTGGGQATGAAVTAGQSLRVPATGALPTPASAIAEDLAPWRTGRLAYRDTPLADIVEDVNRYAPGSLSVKPDGTGDLRVTVAFDVREPQTLTKLISAIYPVSAQRKPDGGYLLGRAGAATEPMDAAR